MSWHVVNTLPHQEPRAESNLLRQGFLAWLPRIRRTRRHARRVESILAPLFPGYLFVELDLATDTWSPINGTFGVRRLVMAEANRPAEAPEAFVASLRAALDRDGAVVLPAADLEPGQTVRIVDGPFTDLAASVLRLASGDRVMLLLNILGRPVTATTPRRAVVAA